MQDFRHVHIKTAQTPQITVFDAIKCFKEFGDHSGHSKRGQKNLYTPKN